VFKQPKTLATQVADLHQEITGSPATASDIAAWVKLIESQGLTLEALRRILAQRASDRRDQDLIEDIAQELDSQEYTADHDQDQATVGTPIVAGSTGAAGGSSMIGIVAGGAAMAAAAGGGGGGSSAISVPTSTPYVATPVSNNAPLPSPPVANNKTFTIGTAPLLVRDDWWLGDAVSVDLNRDGVNELIVLGSKSQPSTIANWSDSYIQILGFNTGKLAIETSRWLSGNSNRVLGALAGKITGDFNGDGYTDLWIGPSTDMRHYGSGVVLFNQAGQGLRRVEVDIGDMWVHDVAIADFNRDGYDDILPMGWGPDWRMLFGRADGTFDVMVNGGPAPYGAGIAAADFLGNGTTTFIVTDTETVNGSDTGLYTWGFDNSGFRMDRIATLPAERFNLPKWNTGEYDWDWIPHSIRVLAHDFDRDGDPDAIIFTTYYDNNIGGHSRSEVQFLRNNGNASFTDVTDNLLLNYNNRTNLGISPQLVDVNNDGRLDIWLTAGDADGAEDSSRVLLAQSNGTFREIMAAELAQFRRDVGGETSFVHYMEDTQGRDYIVGIEKYSYTGNNQVEFVAAPLSNYYSADWIA